MRNANQIAKREGKREEPQHSARQLGWVTKIGARNPRSTCCDAEGPGPRDICIRLVRHFMCRPCVPQKPHPAVLGQLEVPLNGELGRIPSSPSRPFALPCPRLLPTDHPPNERGRQREPAEAKKEGGERRQTKEGKQRRKKRQDGREKNEASRKTKEDGRKRKQNKGRGRKREGRRRMKAEEKTRREER